MGLFIKGTCKGTRVQHRANKQTGEAYNDVFVGIEVIRHGDYGPLAETIECRFSKAQISAGVPALYGKLIGKEISAPVWVRVWQSVDKQKAGFELFLGDDGKPSLLVPEKAA